MEIRVVPSAQLVKRRRGCAVCVKTIAAGRYAMFVHTGPYAGLGGAYHKIFREWLPRSGCELCDSPGFERYPNNPDRVPAEKLKTEIYIPLK